MKLLAMLSVFLGPMLIACRGAETEPASKTLMMAVQPTQMFVTQGGPSATFKITYEGTARDEPVNSFAVGPTVGMAWPTGLQFHPDTTCTGSGATVCPLPSDGSFTADPSTQAGYYFFEVAAATPSANASTLVEVIVNP